MKLSMDLTACFVVREVLTGAGDRDILGDPLRDGDLVVAAVRFRGRLLAQPEFLLLDTWNAGAHHMTFWVNAEPLEDFDFEAGVYTTTGAVGGDNVQMPIARTTLFVGKQIE